jgi:hypothetical protein
MELTTMLITFLQGVTGAFPPVTGGSTMARELNVEIQGQWSEILSFIDSFYIELAVVAKFPPAKAWALVGRCVAAVFGVMAPYRARVALLANPRLLAHKAGHIWAVLQCHRVVQQFIRLNFRGHPAVVKEMSLFMLTKRVDPSEMEWLQNRLKAAEAAAEAATKGLDAATTSIATLKRGYDNLVEDIKWLKANKPPKPNK